jgi:hypothetical protein
MSFKNFRNLKQVTLFISIFLLISQNSCKIQDAPSNSNVVGFVDIAKLRPEMKVQQSEVLNWIAANIPDEHKSSLQLNQMQQRFIDNHHVIKIPISNDAALFFTKDSAKLKAFAYKWDDRDPGTKRYTGHIISYSFQDFSIRALKYYEGKKVSDATLIDNSSSFFPGKGAVSMSLNSVVATQGLLATRGENKLRVMSILGDIWCVLTGGTVYDTVGTGETNCDYSNGWIQSVMSFLSQVFGSGSGSGNNGNYGTDPSSPAGVWYGPGAYTGPSPDQGGGGGNGTSPATQPYTGGPVWVSQWVDTTNPDNCMTMDEFGNMTWVPGGCSTGYWQSVQVDSQATLEVALEHELDLNPYLLIRCDVLQKFKDLASITPPQSVIDRMNNLNFASGDPSKNQYYVQNIKFAAGWAINLDRFEINVATLPVVNGVRDPGVFLEYIRTNLNSFIDNNITTFQPYVDPAHNIDDTNLWLSSNPVSAFLHLSIYSPIPGLGDNGSVVVDDHTNSHWTVSTIKTPVDGNHPVTGNRQWGYDTNSDGTYTFYVTGADRITRPFGQLAQTVLSIPFDQADNLWKSYQSGVEAFINTHGGSAVKDLTPTTLRPDYQAIANYFNGTLTLAQFKANHGCQ